MGYEQELQVRAQLEVSFFRWRSLPPKNEVWKSLQVCQVQVTPPRRGWKESEPVKPIPISSAKAIAEKYGYSQVVIIARAVGEGEHCTTYGVDKANCEVAARIGDFLKYEIMKWDREKEHKCKPDDRGSRGDFNPLD